MKAGFSKIDITPPLGTLLGGQLHEKRAERVESCLFATSMCVDDGQNLTLFISCDLLMINTEFATMLKNKLVSLLPIRQEHVFIGATHTHSGPLTVAVFGMESEGQYLDELPGKICTSAQRAYENMEDSSLHVCAVECDNLAFNRRFIMEDGKVSDSPVEM